MEKGKGVIQFTITYCEDGTFNVDILGKNITFEALDALVQEGFVTAKLALEMIKNHNDRKGEFIQ